MSNETKTVNGQPIVQIDYSENTDKYLGVPYIVVDGEHIDLQVGDVINVSMSSDEAFGYPTYRKVTITGFNKGSLNGLVRGRFHGSDKKRVNYSKIADGADENTRASWGGTVGDPVIFLKTAAQAKADRLAREAVRKAEQDEQRYQNEAKNRAYVGNQRQRETEHALQQAKQAATEAILIKYATEIEALAAIAASDAIAKVNAEYPEVEGQFVVVTTLDSYYALQNSYAFDTEDEALAFATKWSEGEDEMEENYRDDITVVGPVTL
jgi:hypothetical protein